MKRMLYENIVDLDQLSLLLSSSVVALGSLIFKNQLIQEENLHSRDTSFNSPQIVRVGNLNEHEEIECDLKTIYYRT